MIREKPVTVVIRFRADQAAYVRERQWHPSQKFRDLADGGTELTLRAGGELEIARWLVGWCDSAEVIRPATFRKEIARKLRRASRLYSATLPRGVA